MIQRIGDVQTCCLLIVTPWNPNNTTADYGRRTAMIDHCERRTNGVRIKTTQPDFASPSSRLGQIPQPSDRSFKKFPHSPRSRGVAMGLQVIQIGAAVTATHHLQVKSQIFLKLTANATRIVCRPGTPSRAGQSTAAPGIAQMEPARILRRQQLGDPLSQRTVTPQTLLQFHGAQYFQRLGDIREEFSVGELGSNRHLSFTVQEEKQGDLRLQALAEVTS